MKKKTRAKIERFDLAIVRFLREYADEAGRFALFIIFFWFGILKVLGLSPAGPLVVDLLDTTFLSFLEPAAFLVWFGWFEVLIGAMVLIPKLERLTFAVMAAHLITTVMPLFMLSHVTWSQAFVPTLVGQYIIKNAALLSVGLLLVARLKPMTKTHSFWGKFN